MIDRPRFDFERALAQKARADPTLSDEERGMVLAWHARARVFDSPDPELWRAAETVLVALDALTAARQNATLDQTTYETRVGALLGRCPVPVHLAMLNLMRTRAVAAAHVLGRHIRQN